MDQARRVVFAFLISAILSSLIYGQFYNQKERNRKELGGIEWSFKTTGIEDGEIVDLNLKKYTDVTYLDLTITAKNNWDHQINLKSPAVKLYLEEVLIQEKKLSDLTLPAGSTTSIALKDLTFNSEAINKAIKGRIGRPDEALNLSALLTFEYPFEIRNIRFASYRIPATSTGKILFRQIFGGRTQEEAVDVIIQSLNISQ